MRRILHWVLILTGVYLLIGVVNLVMSFSNAGSGSSPSLGAMFNAVVLWPTMGFGQAF